MKLIVSVCHGRNWIELSKLSNCLKFFNNVTTFDANEVFFNLYINCLLTIKLALFAEAEQGLQ
jgi:hypothetical protein